MKDMSKKNISKLLVLGLLIGGTGFATVHQAEADSSSKDRGSFFEQDNHHSPMRGGHNFMENVTQTIENIDDGVMITLTTDDAETLERIQGFAELDPDKVPRGDVTRTIVQLDDGVQITMTSDDPETVQKLQEDQHVGPVRGPNHGGGFMMGLQDEAVSSSIQNLDNGVQITFTSDDADMVSKLQEMAQHMQDQSDQQ